MEDAINIDAKQIPKGIKSDDQIGCTAKNTAFITHIRTSTPGRLLKPCKSEFGKTNKLISEKENKYLGDLLSLNQWKKSDIIINWFSPIKNKSQCAFIRLNIINILCRNNGSKT